MEFRFHYFPQPGRDHGLRNSVRYSGHAENPGPAPCAFGISTAFTGGGK